MCRNYQALFLLFRGPRSRCGAGEVGVDEAVEVAVHHGVDVRALKARAGILHKGIGHEDVGADLAAPLDLLLHALDVGNFLEVLALLDLDELRAQHAHTRFLVLELVALRLAGDDDAGRLMDEADGGGRLVDVLAACAGRAVDLHFNVLGTNFDLDVVRNLRDDLHGGERRVAAARRVERRDAHEAVHAGLALQEAIGVVALDHDICRLQAGLVAVEIVENFIGKAVCLGPAGIHAVEHGAPVLRLRAARARVEGQQRVVRVIFARQQGLQAGFLHVVLQLFIPGGQLIQQSDLFNGWIY